MRPNGYGILSMQDKSPQETLTSDQSSMSSPAISVATRSAISLPDLADGAQLSGSRDGETGDPSGLALAPVSPSRSRARKKALPTNATSGLNSAGSSRSDLLQSFMESRLRTQLRGSAACEVIWKPWVTPWGQSLWKPRARLRTITEIAFGLWPTMTSNAPAKPGYNEAGNSAGQVAIRKIMMGLYPTCRANEGTGAKIPPNRMGGPALKTVVLSLWSTLRASDGEKGGPNMSFGAGGSPLPSQVSAAANSSNAPTENGAGSLHPEFAGWELGYPPVWLSCAPSATPSTFERRQNSFAPQCDSHSVVGDVRQPE